MAMWRSLVQDGSEQVEGAELAAIFRGLAQGHASRQVVAAAAASAIRTLLEPGRELRVERELRARLGMATPALRKLVGRETPTGAQRAARNFALHAEFGCGSEALPASARDAA